MNTIDTNWPLRRYCGFLALVLASLLSSSFALYAIVDKEAGKKDYYIGIAVLLIHLITIVVLWRRRKTDAVAACMIGAAGPSVAALFIWFTGL
jgi:hypothetical protein